MTEPPSQQTTHNSSEGSLPYRLTLYVLLGIILVLVVIGTVYFSKGSKQSPEVESRQLTFITVTSSPPPTATASATITPTLRATFTPKPTQTSTASPSPTATLQPTLLPSLTPAIPVEENDRYHLTDWSPELASELIALLEAYPETLSDFARGSDNSGYYSAFKIAVLAQREALLRFPTAPQADDWQWQLAYNYARTGDERAGEMFATMIASELNNQRVPLNTLYNWGQSKNPPLTIEVVPLRIPAGYLSNNLVRVSAEEHGSSYFWLLEKANGFTVYPLATEFDFLRPTAVNYFVEDLIGTGDTIVGIYHTGNPGSLKYTKPRIFNLVGEPPSELPFEPSIPPDVWPNFLGTWSLIPRSEENGSLEFSTTVFPSCPVTIRHLYRWDGRAFSFLRAEYNLDPQPELLAYCELVVDQAINIWGLEPAVQFMEELLPDWPPAQNLQGAPYPADAQDAWRFKLSVYHALLGNRDQAIGYASAIAENPTIPESAWIEPARAFLATYRDQRDIYRACLLTLYCDPQLAFESLVETLPSREFSQVVEILRNAGVFIRSNGYFDFDLDNRTERWVAIRHRPGASLELWILFQHQDRVLARFVNSLESDTVRFSPIDPLTEPLLIKLEPNTIFKIETQGTDRLPEVVLSEYRPLFSVDRTQMELDILEENLLSGSDPESIRQELVRIGEAPFFTCNFQLCPRYYYLLGLSSELTGKERQAVDAYLELWRRFLDSPYATIARFKLQGPAIPPGPTITPTLTATRPVTATPTRTPTITGTPPTATLTPTRTTPPTLTPTITNTPPGYNPPP